MIKSPESLEQQLCELDRVAEAYGVTDVRVTIAALLCDICEPAGKDIARSAIPKIRRRLAALQGRRSEERLCTGESAEEPAFLDPDDIIA